jgi:hypothetical protein
MAKKRTAAAAGTQPATDEGTQSPQPDADEGARQWTSTLPEPHGRHSIDLGDGRQLKFSLSRRWHQNMIQFLATKEGVDPRPTPEDTEYLKRNGWTWRQQEKAWTRQLAKSDDDNRFARAYSDRDAEDQFVTLANAIRARNGLEPTAYSFGQDFGRGRP